MVSELSSAMFLDPRGRASCCLRLCSPRLISLASVFRPQTDPQAGALRSSCCYLLLRHLLYRCCFLLDFQNQAAQDLRELQAPLLCLEQVGRLQWVVRLVRQIPSLAVERIGR